MIDRLVRFGHPKVACVGLGAHPPSLLVDPQLAEVVLNLEPELGVVEGLRLALGPHHQGLREPLVIAQSNLYRVLLTCQPDLVSFPLPSPIVG
jgi:hypothetical protein